ncbi:NUDIX domain-containing protein [Arthrobacter sp. KNU-44]|uniref:NUDIX domain-containing protein n=1 Tax=Arthrobacter sp. KNU-44 TaxID=3450744 RepID=UPI003F42D75B
MATAEGLPSIPSARTVVAVVIEWRGKIALFKRSPHSDHDRGLWGFISGYIEPGVSPRQQALHELLNEAGLDAATLLDLRTSIAQVISDDDGAPWLVHPYKAVTTQRRLRIGKMHESYRWTDSHKVRRFGNRVRWLEPVLRATDAAELGEPPRDPERSPAPPLAPRLSGRESPLHLAKHSNAPPAG